MSEPTSILDRLHPSAQNTLDEIDVYSEGDDYRAFGFSRKPISSDPMINFIDRRGVHEAIAYGHLYRIQFDPSEGITLEFTDHIVTIRGRRLHEGHRKLVMQRVVFVCEADQPTAALVGQNEPAITKLEICSKQDTVKCLSTEFVDKRKTPR